MPDMVLNIHSDASYLSESGARSRACGHFFMGWMPKNREPVKLNGAFYTSSSIMRFVVASAAEAELGALFHNCQTGMIFRQTLKNLGLKRLSIVTMLLQWEQLVTLFNGNDHDRWKCDFSGWETRWHKKCMASPGTGNGKSGGLPEQTPHRIAPRSSQTILFAPRKLTENITMGNKTQHSERVCWNPRKWVPT